MERKGDENSSHLTTEDLTELARRGTEGESLDQTSLAPQGTSCTAVDETSRKPSEAQIDAALEKLDRDLDTVFENFEEADSLLFNIQLKKELTASQREEMLQNFENELNKIEGITVIQYTASVRKALLAKAKEADKIADKTADDLKQSLIFSNQNPTVTPWKESLQEIIQKAEESEACWENLRAAFEVAHTCATEESKRKWAEKLKKIKILQTMAALRTNYYKACRDTTPPLLLENELINTRDASAADAEKSDEN